MHFDIVIVGGGVIGLAIAHELAAPGRSVVVLDRGNPRDAASWAAAGMLAPQSESEAPSPLFDLCLASARVYREWSDRLREESGIDPEYSSSGLLSIASTEDQFCRLKRAAEWQSAAGLDADVLSGQDALRLEPQITLPLTGAVLMPNEHRVTPRRLLESLRAACAAKGVELRNDVQCVAVLGARDRVSGVRTSREDIDCGTVIVASGVWSPQIEGLRPAIPVAPRKGQLLSLRPGEPGFGRMIRWEHIYLVPRGSGELILGATNEDSGFDRSLTPAGLGNLLAKAQTLSSHVGRFPIEEMWSGLRPATPDGLPVIGKAAPEGLVYATGHYRNGVLLAPITAASVARLVENRTPPASLDAFAPSRFAV